MCNKNKGGNSNKNNYFCVERAEELIMSLGYVYNEKFKLFEKHVSIIDKNNNTKNHLITISIDNKTKKTYYLLIDERHDIETVTKEILPSETFTKYLGCLPSSEIDFNILSNLLSLKNNNINEEYIDKTYFESIVNKFTKLLGESGYHFNPLNNKYFKEIISYTNKPIYLSIHLDIEKDILQIAEEYSESSLYLQEITNLQNHDSTLTLYNGKIPRTKFEFHTLSNLIDLYI